MWLLWITTYFQDEHYYLSCRKIQETEATPYLDTHISRNKSENHRPASLTSVICNLLERLINDHTVNVVIKHALLNPSQH